MVDSVSHSEFCVRCKDRTSWRRCKFLDAVAHGIDGWWKDEKLMKIEILQSQGGVLQLLSASGDDRGGEGGRFE